MELQLKKSELQKLVVVDDPNEVMAELERNQAGKDIKQTEA